MKCVLPDALHARPANLLVRLVAQHDATIEVRLGDRTADARKIMDVLSLGAHKGDEIEITASGDEASLVLSALSELIARNFDADLVPEIGACAVEGIAIGQAWVLEDAKPAPRVRGSAVEERARLSDALARARSGVDALVKALPDDEGALFEPEIAILDDIETVVLARVDAGESAEEAVLALSVAGIPDLVLDARTRLLDALACPDAARTPTVAGAANLGRAAAEQVLITELLTPSIVATLPPSVTGIVVGMDDAVAPRGMGTGHPSGSGYTSHAAILARSRGIPLLHVPPHIIASVADGDLVVLDTTVVPACLWVDPSEALVGAARDRREARARAAEEEDERSTAKLALGLAVRVNIGSASESVPPGAEGIGLIRTELVFAGRTLPPSEAEQFGVIMAIARRARGAPVNVRLFDAGGDKPLPWLAPPPSSVGARGMELLLAHPDVLGAQLRAIARARAHENVRALLPLVRTPRDVCDVRTLLGEGIEVGAMVETAEAVATIDVIAAASDFVCIGTNDLAASILGVERAGMEVSFDVRVLNALAQIIAGARLHGRSVTVCGEMAGDVLGARLLFGLGVDAISVAPVRVAPIKRSLAGDTLESCQVAAKEALRGGAIAMLARMHA